MPFYRTEWPKEQFIPPYVPRFRNGWEPPMLNFMGAPVEQDLYQLSGSVANVADHQHRHETKRYSPEVKVFFNISFAANAMICAFSCNCDCEF